MQDCFQVEGITVNCDSLSSTAAKVVADAGQGPSFGVFTLNLDHVVKLRASHRFRQAYRTARYVTADGFPIVWAGRLAGVAVDRVTGADLIEPLCCEAAKTGRAVSFFGSRPEALDGAARYLRTRFPGLEIAAAISPQKQFDPNSDEARDYVRQIAQSGAQICFVALGAPKQELFTELALEETTGVAFVCIGAGLDFLADVQKRAPQWARNIGAEWAWRLMCEPRRLGRRYLDCALVLPRVLLTSVVRQRV